MFRSHQPHPHRRPLTRRRSLPSLHKVEPDPQGPTAANDEAIQKISALETELAKLRAQIAQIVLAQEKTTQPGVSSSNFESIQTHFAWPTGFHAVTDVWSPSPPSVMSCACLWMAADFHILLQGCEIPLPLLFHLSSCHWDPSTSSSTLWCPASTSSSPTSTSSSSTPQPAAHLLSH